MTTSVRWHHLPSQENERILKKVRVLKPGINPVGFLILKKFCPVKGNFGMPMYLQGLFFIDFF